MRLESSPRVVKNPIESDIKQSPMSYNSLWTFENLVSQTHCHILSVKAKILSSPFSRNPFLLHYKYLCNKLAILICYHVNILVFVSIKKIPARKAI